MTVQCHNLKVADLVIASGSSVITTILGSCVSVCLYSPTKKIGGMIHYALPSEPQGQLADLLRYGETAIPKLITELKKKTGDARLDLKAKVVGGAAVMDELAQAGNIGLQNVQIAEKVLHQAGIPITGQDILGVRGRRVYFYPSTGRLRMSYLDSKAAQGESSAPSTAKRATAAPVASVRRKRRVLVIDDSKTIQTLLMKILNEDSELEVVGVAPNPIVARDLIAKLKPDVLTLDIHMPEMDGVTFLKEDFHKFQLPVLMITSISLEESDYVFRALELGALDYIQKPTLNQLAELAPVIREKVLAASHARVRRPTVKPTKTRGLKLLASPSDTIVAIGASTGGTEALREVLTQLPADIPPIVIVQHIPAVFSAAFAERLNQLCPFSVREARDGDPVTKGQVLIAPGGRQMALEKTSSGYKVRVSDDPPVNRHKPSVDHLFFSVANLVGDKAIGIILTGMGADGAEGLLAMKKKGARTIAQDENSSVVYGMPKVAIELGASDEVRDLHEIPDLMVKWLTNKSKESA